MKKRSLNKLKSTTGTGWERLRMTKNVSSANESTTAPTVRAEPQPQASPSTMVAVSRPNPRIATIPPSGSGMVVAVSSFVSRRIRQPTTTARMLIGTLM